MKIRSAVLITFAAFCCVESCLAWQDDSLTIGGDGAIEQVDGEDNPDAVPDPMDAGIEEKYVQRQTQAVDRELLQLKAKLQLDDEWIESLKISLKDDIKKVAEDIADKANDFVFGFEKNLDSRIREIVWEEIEGMLPEGKNAAFEEFKGMISRMQKLQDETAVNGILVFLDDQLCLSVEQIDRLRILYSKDWDSSLNEQVGILTMNGMIFGRSTIDSIGLDELEKTLSTKQFEVFEVLGQDSNCLKEILMGGMGQKDDAAGLDAIRLFCDDALDLKLAEYKDLVGISERQMKLISVARKGAVAQIVARYDELLKTGLGNPDALNGMSIEIERTLVEPVVSQCMRTRAWKKTLGKIFDETQMQKIEERESARKALATDQVVNYMFYSMGANLGLTYDQHVKVVDAIKKSIGDSSTNYVLFAMRILNVPKEEFQEILNDEQWELFKLMLDEQRVLLEQMQDKPAEDEDSEDE